MGLGLGLGLWNAQRGFNPMASLLPGASVLAVYDPSDMSTLFQDRAGTTRVTAPGQLVGQIMDKGPGGFHRTAMTDAARATYARHPAGGIRNTVSDSRLSQWGAIRGGTGVAPVVNTIAASSTATLPDGAAGADAGKGWTCTGLALDGSTLWWGNIAQSLEGQPIGQRQLIQTNLAGSSILQAVSIAESPQGVAVSGDWLFYAQPALGQVRRIAKTGGAETVVASVASANGLATNGDVWWVSSGTTLQLFNASWVLTGTFDVGVQVDHLHYDAARDWLWITSGGNGAAGVLTIWSVAQGKALNTYRLTQAQAIEGLVLSGGNMIVSHDGYYHGPDITDPTRRFNEIQTYSTAIITGGIWSGGLADYVFFDRGASDTSADFSQIQVPTSASGARVASAWLWVASGTPNVALNVSDAGGNTQEVKSLTTTPTRNQTYRSTSSTSETVMLRIRGGVTATQTLGLFVGLPQVEAGATPTAAQFVATVADITEEGQPSVWSLIYSGAQAYSTATMTPGVDKAQVFAGLRKQSDAARGIFAEFGSGGRGWQINAPNASLNNYQFGSVGSVGAFATSPSTFVSPVTNVVTGIGDISGDNCILRINGTQSAQTVTDQGTGDYGVTQLFFGGRSGTSLFFAGREYGTIVRFSAANLDAGLIARTERNWVAPRTGVTL